MLSGRVHLCTAVLALVAVAGLAIGAAAQSATTVEGTIATASPTSATIATKMGSTTVMLNGKTRVTRRMAATIADIKVGTFLGVAAKKSADGSLTAVSINIIDAIPNARRGQWPMESGDIMTNMNVTSIVAGMSGHTLTLREKDQTATILVPGNTSIHRIELGKLSDLKAGTHVTVRGESDGYGVITAAFVTIE